MAIGAGNAGAWAAVNATTQTVTLPTHAAGTQLILVAACKAATPASVDIQVTTPATGWEKIGQFADGTTTTGVGVGSVTQAIFRRICTSSSETNPVVTWGGSQTSTPGIAVAVGFTKAAGEVWLDPALVQAATTNATSISVTMGSNPGITGGDFGLAVHTTRDDSALTVPTWSATGTTLGTATVFPATPIASGTSDDMAGTVAYRSVTSGLATAAPVVTATQAAAETGVTAFVRLRVGNIAPNRKLLSATRNTTGTSTVATGSVTVTAGNTIFVVAASYVNSAFGSESVTDNLGNSYSLVTRLRRAADFERLSLYMAPVTVGGTMTTLTYNHDSSQFVGTVSIEYTSVGDISGSPYTGDGNGTTDTWLSSSSIPAGGMAIGGTSNSGDQNFTAGAASGSPSTTIVELDGWSTTGQSATILNALAPAAVTGFTGTATTGIAVDWVGVGAVYSRTANVTVTPTTAALVDTLYAPTVTTTAGEVVTPTTAALVATKFAPTVTASDHQLVTPTTKSLALTTFAPTVTATDPQLVTPTTKAITLATFAPTVTTSDNQLVTPTTKSAVIATFAPSVATTDHQAVTPTTKSLTLATFAPLVSTPQTVTPTTKTLALTTFAPTISNPDPQLVTPTTVSLITAKFAPSVGVSDAASIVPPNASLTLTTYAPTVIQPEPQLVTPTTPALELHTFAPVVTATAHQAVTPTTAGLVTARMVPTVTATANQSAIPGTKALTLTTYAPQVTVNNIVATVTIGLTLATFAPSVTATTGSYAFPGFAELTLTGYAPFIDLSAFKLVTPATAVLVLTTYPPTAEQHSITPLPTPIYGFAIVATGPGAGVEGGNGGATVTPSGRGSSTVSTSGPSAKVTIR